MRKPSIAAAALMLATCAAPNVYVPPTAEGSACTRQCLSIYTNCENGMAWSWANCDQQKADCLLTCPGAQVASAGETCPGQFHCGTKCIPQGTQCCGSEGDYCPGAKYAAAQANVAIANEGLNSHRISTLRLIASQHFVDDLNCTRQA